MTWDRQLARGTITSGVGTLPFDAAAAMTDDFHIGEGVDVSLRPQGSSYVVTRIAPVDWRAPKAPRPIVAMEPLLADIQSLIDDRSLFLRGFDEHGSLIVAITPESYQPHRSLAFDGCAFVQMASEMSDVASLSGYAVEDFVKDCPEIAARWPKLPPALTVFRFNMRFFGDAEGYVVASAVRVIVDGG